MIGTIWESIDDFDFLKFDFFEYFESFFNFPQFESDFKIECLFVFIVLILENYFVMCV